MSTLLTGAAHADTSLRGLSFLWLEITAKCNLECGHCYADSGPRHDLLGSMKTEDWLSVLRESAEAGCRHVQFVGGEPTLHPDLPVLISHASAHGYEFIEVFTNATAISDSLLLTFVERGVHVATSFYSDDSETHDSITNRRGSFRRTTATIRRLVDAGVPVRAGVIETPLNAGHAERAKRLLEEIGVSEIGVDFQRGVGRGAQPLHSLDPMGELCGECWKGKLCVSSSGRAYPCVFSRFADLGSVGGGVGDILCGDALPEFRIALREYRLRKESKGRPPAGGQGRPDAGAGEISMGSCGPDVICAPDMSCSPNCNPSSSTCGPVHFCMPRGTCSPNERCDPSYGCQPSIKRTLPAGAG